jgi:transposase
MEQRIERVDEIPLLLHWLSQMGVQENIDCLYQMEEWVEGHQTVIEQITGWDFTSKDAPDDRLGAMLGALGADDSIRVAFQQQMGRHLIQAYALPADVARYDTTSFSVHHGRSDPDGLLRLGHGKDHRPDLLQFKQGLGTLDPAGVALLSETLSGNTADDTFSLSQ